MREPNVHSLIIVPFDIVKPFALFERALLILLNMSLSFHFFSFHFYFLSLFIFSFGVQAVRSGPLAAASAAMLGVRFALDPLPPVATLAMPAHLPALDPLPKFGHASPARVSSLG